MAAPSQELSPIEDLAGRSYVTIFLNLATISGCGVVEDEKNERTTELVAFITVQTGDDLILSFAICKPDDPSDIESLTILRTPKYEFFLDQWERGASVSFDRDLEDDETVLLREVLYASDDKCIALRTDHQTYKLDVRKVDPSELSAMCGVLRKMNFDSTIQLTGV
jgi:hypothetical protein